MGQRPSWQDGCATHLRATETGGMRGQQLGAVPQAWDPGPMGLKGPLSGVLPAFSPVVARGAGQRSLSPLSRRGTEARQELPGRSCRCLTFRRQSIRVLTPCVLSGPRHPLPLCAQPCWLGDGLPKPSTHPLASGPCTAQRRCLRSRGAHRTGGDIFRGLWSSQVGQPQPAARSPCLLASHKPGSGTGRLRGRCREAKASPSVPTAAACPGLHVPGTPQGLEARAPQGQMQGLDSGLGYLRGPPGRN